MADEEERALGRAWRATGAAADGVAYLRARLRNGTLAPARLELAALLGEPAAAAALAGGPRLTLDPGSGRPRLMAEHGLSWLEQARERDSRDRPRVETAPRLLSWAEALVPGASLRAALAWFRLAVELCCRADGIDGGQALAVVEAAEAFVASPCAPRAARLLDARAALPEHLPGASARASSAWLTARRAVEAVVEGGPARSSPEVAWTLCTALGRDDADARTDAVRLAAYRAQVTAAVAALVPWALDDDPLAARHGLVAGALQVPIDPPPRDGSGCELEELPAEWSDDPFDAPPATVIEVRRGGAAWRGATQLLTAALRRLRFQLLAGRAHPVTTWFDGGTVTLPYPAGAPAEQLAAVEEAIAAHEAWRRERWPPR